jgi:hypothetical protein
LSGGKGTIVRHKATKNRFEETKEAFYLRVAQYITDDPAHYFMRFKCEISPADVARFQQECLDPLLEQLCTWWDWVSSKEGRRDPFENPIHWRFPYGVSDWLVQGGTGDIDGWLDHGSMIGLQRTNSLFSELAPNEKS